MTGGPTVGFFTVTCSVSDNAGNPGSASATYQVTYDFSGFAKPVLNPAAVNDAKAGTPLPPLKFSLGGDQGLDIFLAGYPATAQYTCGTTPPTTATVPLAKIGPQLLKYDAKDGQYIVNWQSDKSWKNTCRVLILGLKDGTTRSVLYQFK